MGSASSKATRNLPKRVPSWAGARTPPASEPYPTSRPPLASESKSKDVAQDAMDPHFAANLNKLGAVRVDHHMQTMKTAANHQKMYQVRLEPEFEGVEPSKNRLFAMNLSDLLAKRQEATSEAEVRKLADEFGIEFAKLEKLAEYFTAPNAGEGTLVKSVNEEGEEIITTRAVWIDLVYARPQIQ